MTMEDLQLRQMTAAEFDAFRARLIPGYAAEHVRAGDWSPDEAEGLAAEQMDFLLPAGPETPGMLLMSAETDDGDLVGLVWIALQHLGSPGSSWIYYIEIAPGHRGRGYGRALLRAAEQHSARHGAHAIGLNVFGANAVARSLYESSGYEIMSMNMRKELRSQA